MKYEKLFWSNSYIANIISSMVPNIFMNDVNCIVITFTLCACHTIEYCVIDVASLV